MSEHQTSSKKRKPKLLRILLILFLIATTTLITFRLILKERINSRLKTIRAQGFPVSFSELEEYYSIPDDTENAADIINKAIEKYTPPDYETRKFLPVIGLEDLPEPDVPYQESTLNLITQYIKTNYESLALLHQASQVEHSRYPWGLQNGMSCNLSLNGIKKCTQLLNIEMVYHIENHQIDLAVLSIIDALRLAESLSKEPTEIAQLVRLACKALTVDSIQYAVNRTLLSDEQLKQIQSELEKTVDTTSLGYAFIGERCWTIEIAKSRMFLSLFAKHFNLEKNSLRLYILTGLKDYDLLDRLDKIEIFMEIESLSTHKRQAAYDLLTNSDNSLFSIRYLLPPRIADNSALSNINVRIISELLSARTALAIERYRLLNNKIPDTLAELVPKYLSEVPDDPFDGKPLRYRKLNPGYVIYSVGEDLTDQGGISKEELEKKAAQQGHPARPRPRTGEKLTDQGGMKDKNDLYDWPFRVVK